MKEFVFGKYTISAEPVKTLLDYDNRGPHFCRCVCPGCQNFFLAVKPYRAELAAFLAPFGVIWDKPDEIVVLAAREGLVTYEVKYSFCGKILKRPKQWNTHESSLGTINIKNEDAVAALNECIEYEFVRYAKRSYIIVRALLPWKMETMNCIYDENQTEVAKRLPGRAERIYKAAKSIRSGLKN